MSSIYGIVKADLVPGLISEAEYDRCLANPGGSAAATLADLVTQAEGLLHAKARGTPAGSALQATFRPVAIVFILYWLHARRAQQDNAKIPAIVEEQYKDASAWAADSGRNLIEAERVASGGTGAAAGIAVTQVQDPEFTREKMEGF